MTQNTSNLKDFVWKAFESTGSIDAYSFLREIENSRNAVDSSKNVDEELGLSN